MMKKIILTLVLCLFAIVPAFSGEAEYIDALQRCVGGATISEQYSACVEMQNDENVPEALQEAVFFRKIYLVATANTDETKRQEMLARYKDDCMNISENYKVIKLYSGLYEIATGNVKKGEDLCEQAFGMMLYEAGNSMKLKAKGVYKDLFDLTKEMCSENPSMDNIKSILERNNKQ